jgi:uncharacterized cupin superfamily protein
MGLKIIHSDEVEAQTVEHGKSYGWSRKSVTAKSDSRQLGASIYEIPPGQRAWLYHFHHANEELFYVLNGSALIRTIDGEKPVSAGDFISAPAGEEGAHQFVNSGDEPLRYIAVSTMIEPDIVEYPDSEKIFVMSGQAPGGDKSKRSISRVYRKSNTADFWEGEPE